ncbi:MAG TPA: efflux RND transporter periplasmic adaptor subunit [Terracidiphilus sp.]|jgi:cobalt-zinc-cadmium efflux system membrane fusion protein|nr:efflux RND transporter periplasmic adaptor subunit [Terracidiphilus sp.]
MKSLSCSGAVPRLAAVLAVTLVFCGCQKKFDPADGEVKTQQPIETGDANLVNIDHPERYPLATAERVDQPETLSVTGTVNPDISREVPVISMANGRVVDIRARLDDNVKKGQLLMTVQSADVTAAFDTYLKAVNDEQMNNKAYIRAQDLYSHGAISQAMLEQAEDAENDARADLAAAEQQLKILGVDKQHPTDIVHVYAPISGVIVAQNVTNAAAAGVSLSGTATAFTIADLSNVWILCDVYENDLPKVHLGQDARIVINAYPDRPLTGRVSDIGPVLDPNLRTAKVRIEVANPGNLLRLGMFVTATLTGRNAIPRAVVPSSAILHLHDRDWVYVPAGGSQFRRVEVTGGEMLPGDRQTILSGIAPGQQVVRDVVALEGAVEAQ